MEKVEEIKEEANQTEKIWYDELRIKEIQKLSSWEIE